jgi:hypothetical protein
MKVRLTSLCSSGTMKLLDVLVLPVQAENNKYQWG